jgi:hypothetical protein
MYEYEGPTNTKLGMNTKQRTNMKFVMNTTDRTNTEGRKNEIRY